MTAQQRDMVDQILRNAPFGLGGDVAALKALHNTITGARQPGGARLGS